MLKAADIIDHVEEWIEDIFKCIYCCKKNKDSKKSLAKLFFHSASNKIELAESAHQDFNLEFSFLKDDPMLCSEEVLIYLKDKMNNQAEKIEKAKVELSCLNYLSQ